MQGAHLRVWSQADYFFRLFPLWNWACSYLADAKVRKKNEKDEFLGLRIVKLDKYVMSEAIGMPIC